MSRTLFSPFTSSSRLRLVLALGAVLTGFVTQARAVGPAEIVPPLTPGLEDRLRQEPPVEARVVSREDGQVRLEVSGRDEPFLVGGIKGFVPREKMRVKVWKDTNFNLVFVYFDLGYMCSRFGFVSPPLYNRSFWDGPQTFVREDVEKVLWRVLCVYPKAQIILWPWIDVYPEWAAEHPGEVMRNDQGQPFIVRNHFERVGNDADPAKKERLAWSMFSEVFRREAGDMLREFVHTVETSLPGRRVAGYVLGGGQDAQLYAWDAPDYALQENPALWGDYSEPALRAWRAWLKSTYKNPEALSAAWGFHVASVDTAPPPPARNLVGPPQYHNPATEKQAIDWLRFLAEGRADLCSYFAAVVRDTVHRPILVGVSGGDGGARYALTATSRLLRDPGIDILFHQPTYGAERRLPPSVGGINGMLGSHPLHKKLFMADMDQRTWLTASLGGTKNLGVISFSDQSVGRAENMEQLRAMWRRELARLWADGAGALFHPLVDPDTYEDPAIQEELKFLHAQADAFPPMPAADRREEVAVIYDERSVAYLKGALARRHGEWTDGQQSRLNASGVPYHFYYADDLRDGLVPPAKMYLFINLLDLDEPLRAAIEKLKANGVTLVWLQGAGFAQAAQPDMVSRTLGMTVSPLAKASETPAPPLQALPGLEAASLSRDPESGWRVTDPAARPLGFYPKTQEIGAALRDYGDWRSVFVGAHVLDENAINALAGLAGAWRIAPPGNVVSAGRDWISLHPLKDGPVSLHLRCPAPLQAVWPDEITSPAAQDHELNLKAGHTYLFHLSHES